MPAALTGLTVLDLTQVLAGPVAARALGDLGATVIKVERPGSGDDARSFPPFKDGRSAWHAALNRGKKSIALDLKADADRLIFEGLLARCDVLLESFRPGVMDRLGYGWPVLHADFPHLIYGAVSGFGQTGPDARRPGYDVVAQARGGLMALTGTPGGPALRAGAPVADYTAGLYLAQGVLAALVDRARSGRGRMVDVALLDAQLAMLDHAVAMGTVTGQPPGPDGSRLPAVAPSEAVQASDGPFVLAAGNDRLFEKLCIALGLPLVGDARFADNAARCRNARLLNRLIEAVTLDNTRAHWIARLTAAGIPAGPVHEIDQVLKDPQIVARNMVVDVLDRNGRAAYKAAGNPVKMSDAPDPTTRAPAPDLDGNRGEILRWLEQG